MEEEKPDIAPETLRWLKKSGWILGTIVLLLLLYLFFPVIALLAVMSEIVSYEWFEDTLMSGSYANSLEWFMEIVPPYEKAITYLFDLITLWGA